MESANKSKKDLAARLLESRPDWRQSIFNWLTSRSLLFEALTVAVSAHVLLFPIIWVAGWALPWPKSPVITTVVEFDLRFWPNLIKPKAIYEIREPKRNEH